MKPRIFLGSSGKQAKLVEAVTRGLADVADVVPWTVAFDPGVSTLDRLVELTHEVDFAAFVFAQDDWTSNPTDASASGQASPRDNVVFEAGLFGGALGMRRTFILHAKGAKLPTDLLGMTAVRYPEHLTAADMRDVNQKLRKAIEIIEAKPSDSIGRMNQLEHARKRLKYIEIALAAGPGARPFPDGPDLSETGEGRTVLDGW